LDSQDSIKEFARSLRGIGPKAIDDRTARLVVKSILADVLEEAYPLLSNHYGISPTKKIQKVPGYYSVIDELIEMDSVSAAYQLSSFYSLLICQDRRYRDGIYFTPPDLSARVLREISVAYSGDISKARIIDPCSGGGAFLAPLAAELRLDMKKRGIRPSQRIRRISESISGIEVCRTLSELSEALCLIELYPDIEWEQSVPELQIETADFLTRRFEDRSFDVVIGNPPFRRLNASEQSRYLAEFGETRNGGSNMYGLFIQKSLSLLRPGGVVALIIPASLFAGARYAHLRSYISDRAEVVSIQTMQERVGVFMDVQQEAAVITLKRIGPGVRRRKFAKIGIVCEKIKANPIGQCELPRGRSPWVIPRKRGQVEATRLFSKDLPRLADYGIAIRTGSVVWNRDERPRYSTRGRETDNSVSRYPLVWSDCIGADGSFDFERAKCRAPNEVFVGTQDADPELLRSSAIAIKRTSNSKQPRRIYCAFIGKDFVQDYGAYLGENHVNLLVPEGEASSIDLEVLAQVLNSEPVDEAFRCLSGSSAVSKYELSRLPLPDMEYVQKRIVEGFAIGEAVRLGLYE
jgi:adenine-specific DNA-methyltransferase